MKKRLLDSDTLSYLIKGEVKPLRQLETYAQFFTQVTFSVVTYYELRRGLLYRDAYQQITQFEELAADSEIVPISIDVAQEAASLYAHLRASGQLLPDADLLIAATALDHDLVLVTNNTQHFERVPQLETENWTQ